jgi:Ca2+-binding RTX toxin-like protein
VSYATRTAGVAADIDGESDDGSKFDLAGGRRDYVALDVENLIGGAGADALTGDGDANVLDGLAGPDVLRGGLGADTATYAGRSTSVGVKLDGVANDGGPTDERTGSTNRDNLFVENVIGGAGADTITGSAGPNKLTGGLGADTISGLEGADEIFAKDGRADSIVCGADADTLHRDAGLDTFPAVGPTACETVD